MGYEAQNRAAIKRGFSWLKSEQEKIVRDGMYGLLNAGLSYLEDAHDMHSPEMHHEHESDTLGWALVHDGTILETVSQSKGEFTPRGDALGRLQQIASESPVGWVGIIMSDMANDWYRVDYEMDFLHYTQDEIKNHFQDFFKRISA